MAYKDKEKQKEANRAAAQRRRDKSKGMTQLEAMPNVIPDSPANYGQSDCQCRHCTNVRAAGGRHVLNHGPYKPGNELSRHELNRVSLPGDVDYTGKHEHQPAGQQVHKAPEAVALGTI